MIAKLSVTQKGLLILVVVPVMFEVGFFWYIAQRVSEASDRVNYVRSAKDTILGLYEIQSKLARAVLFFSDKSAQQPSVLIPKIEQLKKDLSKRDAWKKIGRLDPELNQLVEDSSTFRHTVLSLLDQATLAIQDHSIPVTERYDAVPRNVLIGLVIEMQEFADKVIRVESRYKLEEPREIERLHSELTAAVLLWLVASILLSILLVHLFSADIIKRLRKISNNVLLASSARSLPPQDSSADEIAVLDGVIHDTNAYLAEIRNRELAILDNAAAVVCSVDHRLRFQMISASVDKIWNYTQDDLSGNSVKNLLASGEEQQTSEFFERISRESTQGEFENMIRTKDGGLRHFRWNVTWSALDKSYFCVAHDITEKKKIEKLKQQFLAIVSHDLRAPLAATGISINLLTSGRYGDLPQGALKVLERTETSIARLTELVNELLELNKLEAGKMILSLEMLSAHDICADARMALEGLAEKNSIKIAPIIGDAVIQADEKRLVQAVCNLLSNAIKFSPAGGTVTLSIEKANSYVRIKVKDDGPGIPPEDTAIIFDKFRQSRTAKLSAEKSSGLGLAIVKAIAESHGGFVGVESIVTEGSTFFISLPEYVGDLLPGESLP